MLGVKGGVRPEILTFERASYTNGKISPHNLQMSIFQA